MSEQARSACASWRGSFRSRRSGLGWRTSAKTEQINDAAQAAGTSEGKSFFLNIKGPEPLNKYVDETARYIRLVFQRDREKAASACQASGSSTCWPRASTSSARTRTYRKPPTPRTAHTSGKMGERIVRIKALVSQQDGHPSRPLDRHRGEHSLPSEGHPLGSAAARSARDNGSLSLISWFLLCGNTTVTVDFRSRLRGYPNSHARGIPHESHTCPSGMCHSISRFVSRSAPPSRVSCERLVLSPGSVHDG
jgi:hypothetical protein